MANHVQGYLSIREISEEGQKVWDEIVSHLNSKLKEGAYEVHLGNYIFEEKDGEFIDWDFTQMCDEIGAKWAFATDFNEYGMSMYSAWSPCLEFVESVAKRIGEVDPSVQMVLTYEDEMPNYIGVATYTSKGMNVDNCLEHDDMMDILKQEEPRLVELWDEDNEEWTDEDEAWELIQDTQWDVISGWQADNEDWDIS